MRSVWKSSLLLSVLIAALSGCDAIFSDGYEVRVELDNDAYLIAPGTELKVAIENRSDHAVYYLCGGEAYIDRYVEGEQVDSFGFANCECLCPNPIEAGQTEQRTYRLDEYLVEWIQAHDGPDRATYIFRLIMYEDTKFQIELDRADQESRPFAFVESDR